MSLQKTGALCTEEERLAPNPPPPPQAGGAEAAARAVLQTCPIRRGCVWGWLTTERAARAGGIAKSARHRPAHGQPHAYAPCTAEAVPHQSPAPHPPPHPNTPSLQKVARAPSSWPCRPSWGAPRPHHRAGEAPDGESTLHEEKKQGARQPEAKRRKGDWAAASRWVCLARVRCSPFWML